MAHPLVDQLRFTRGEWLRGLEGISAEDATRHLGPMNCISWNVAHLAWQEQQCWLDRAQGVMVEPVLARDFCYGAPMFTPPLDVALGCWHAVVARSEEFLDTLTTELLQRDLPYNGDVSGQSIGSAMRRVTYHYWYHIGEIQAIRQMLGHTDLPVYVGDIEELAPYAPEP